MVGSAMRLPKLLENQMRQLSSVGRMSELSSHHFPSTPDARPIPYKTTTVRKSSSFLVSDYLRRHRGELYMKSPTAIEMEEDIPDDAEATTPFFERPIVKRFVLTTEVAVSKIFPAGFGWQLFATKASEMGFEGNDLGFALMTGAGDFAGVLLGHCLYYTAKSLTNEPVNLSFEYKTGLFLASAAFFSGGVWQPVVNTLQAAELPWLAVAGGTWMACGAAFYAGCRFFRTVYSPLGIVRPSDYANLKSDAALSMSIGGATGAFVGTDMVYLPDHNPLKDLVGVASTDTMQEACTKAGMSTAMGFYGAQTMQNVAYPRGRNWTDGTKVKLHYPTK
jgi:hypothetical protein